MCVCVFVCMCVYVCVCMCVCVCGEGGQGVCISVCRYVCMHVGGWVVVVELPCVMSLFTVDLLFMSKTGILVFFYV